jgi:hypothetical protein
MLWRSDTDAAYVFYKDHRWFQVDERWDGKPPRERGTPPSGLQAPIRGFGYVWGLRDDIFAGLGWATDREKGFCAALQDFEHGFLIQSSNVVSCTADNLYNHAIEASWSPLSLATTEDGSWRNAR